MFSSSSIRSTTLSCLLPRRYNNILKSNKFHLRFLHNTKNLLNKLHVAIIGSGPSGCYTAKYLLSYFDKRKQEQDVQSNSSSSSSSSSSSFKAIDITILERLPTPFGLIRSGIAPDHPEVKNVQDEFTNLFIQYHPTNSPCLHPNQQEQSLRDQEVAKDHSISSTLVFRGNVSICDSNSDAGQNKSYNNNTITWMELSYLYHIVIFAYGCADSDVPFVLQSQQEKEKELKNASVYNKDPKNHLKGIFSAREFVAWYNGHPQFATSSMTTQLKECLVHTHDDSSSCNQNHPEDSSSSSSSTIMTQSSTLSPPNITTRNKKHIVIIGNGNVALDCARILAKGSFSSNPFQEKIHHTHKNKLWETDIIHEAITLLSQTDISTITILGRRGHVQGAFTIKELRELITLQQEEEEEKERKNIKLIVYTEELNLGMNSSTKQELDLSKPKVRIDTLLRQHAISMKQKQEEEEEEESTTRKIELRFLFNPIQFIPHPKDPTRIGSILCQRTLLQGPAGKQIAIVKETEEQDPNNNNNNNKTKKSDEVIELPADLVLISIGYRGIPLAGMDDSNHIFDKKRGILNNIKGRVTITREASVGMIGTGEEKTNKKDMQHKGTEALLYVVGWIKRGPTGIIGTNIPDAKETVSSILEDLDQYQEEINNRSVGGRQGLDELLQQRSIPYVDFKDYLLIDQREKDPSRLRSILQPREKITSIEEMLSIVSKHEE